MSPHRIFVSHGSALFTDYRAHGDGLLVYEFIKRLAELGYQIHVAAWEVALAAPLPDGVTVHEIPLRLGGSMRRVEYALRSRRLFERLGGARAFDLVHQFNPVFTGLSLSFIGCGVPLVLGSYPKQWPHETKRGHSRGARTFVAAAQQQLASAILLSTPSASERVVSNTVARDRAVILPFGVDPQHFQPRVGAAPQTPTLLYLASIEHRKGIYTLLDALPTLFTTLPALRVIVAGSGSELENVRKRVLASPFANDIDVLGHIDRSDLPRLMHAASVYCLPSFGEPFGMTALEAMSCGLPLVVTNTGGLSELVDEEGAIRVSPGDITALADALTKILSSPQLAARMGEHNRRRVLATFAWDVVIDRLDRIYAAVLGGGMTVLPAFMRVSP